MKPQVPTQYSKLDDPLVDAEGIEETSEDDLWFLPGPIEVEPDYLPPRPRAELPETIGGRQRQVMPPVLPVWLAGLARWMTVCTVARKAGGSGAP